MSTTTKDRRITGYLSKISRSRPQVDHTCEQCDAPFVARDSRARYCGARCRQAAHRAALRNAKPAKKP